MCVLASARACPRSSEELEGFKEFRNVVGVPCSTAISDMVLGCDDGFEHNDELTSGDQATTPQPPTISSPRTQVHLSVKRLL